MAQPGMEEEIAEGFGWLRPEAEAGGRGRGRDFAGAGEKECEGATGVATLGSSWSGTLGRPGAGLRDCLVGDSVKRRHDSKIFRRLVIASS